MLSATKTANRTFTLLQRHTGVAIMLFFLAVHLIVINGYGFTWDFHFHFFGGGKLLGIEPEVLEPRPLPFVEPDPRRAWTLPYGAIMSIPPVASYLFFHKTLGLLPADSAYHLPIILWGVAGIGILYGFLKEAINKRAAVIGAIFLGLMPRYFGDLHNNMKDIPSAVIFALNMWLIWRLVQYKRSGDLIAAAVAFAVAFNIKINSIFIPVVFAAWLMTIVIRNRTLKPRIAVWYFVLAPVLAYLLWWVFWPDPVGQLRHAFFTFGIGTNNIEVILNGKWYCSGSTVPWYYPFWYLLITTPVPVLIGFFVGLISLFTRRGQLYPTNLLLVLWLFLPLSRYILPQVGVIDGIRHFEEVLFPIAAISAIGLDTLLTRIKNSRLRIGSIAAIILFLIYTVASYHPYQITYFNELVGGTKGAMGHYDLDYWGTSQKEAALWVNANAPQNAKVHIVMSAAVAAQYLRSDLLPQLNHYGYDDSDFVILLNRQSFLYRFFYAYEFLLHHRATHTVSVRGAPLVWIYDNRTENKIPRQQPWWQDEDPCIIKYWKGETP